MVKYYELLDLTNDDGPRAMINAHEEGEWVERTDYEKLLAASADLVAALRVANYVWHGADLVHQAALLGARRAVEELLK